jgi:hypothetical protein
MLSIEVGTKYVKWYQKNYRLHPTGGKRYDLVDIGAGDDKGAVMKKRGRPKVETSKERLSVFSLKGSPEYRDWLNMLSDKSRITVATIVRDSVAEWAKKRGYPAPPEL